MSKDLFHTSLRREDKFQNQLFTKIEMILEENEKDRCKPVFGRIKSNTLYIVC